MGQDQSSQFIDDDTPTQTLDSRTLESVAKLIKDGRARRIVVMVSTTRVFPGSNNLLILCRLAQE